MQGENPHPFPYISLRTACIMKRHHTPAPASTPFPVDTLRSFFGMPDLPAPPEPEPPRIKTVIPKLRQPLKKTKKSREPQVTRGVSIYKGTIPFKEWLNSPDATLENLVALEVIFLNTKGDPEKYLKRIGFDPGPRTKGEMMARIHYMKFSAIMRSMLKKYKLKQYSGMAEFHHDKRKLIAFLGLRSTHPFDDSALFDIMDHTSSPEEMGIKAIRHFFVVKSQKRCKGILWYLLIQHAYTSFYQLLNSKCNHAEFIGAYAMTMLNCLHLVDLSDSYWGNKEVQQRLDDICIAYQRIHARDQKFVTSHFPNTVAIFRKKRAPDMLLLHTLYLKRMIYQSSAKRVPFDQLLDEISTYSLEAAIQFNYSAEELKVNYKLLKHVHDLKAYRELETMMQVVKSPVIGLIAREVKQVPPAPITYTPPITYVSSVPSKAPRTPIPLNETALVVRALSAYSGKISMDEWLNHSDTFWSECSHVAHILSRRKDHAFAYLTACGMTADVETAGYFRGKIAAMEGICLLRQIFARIKEGMYTLPNDCMQDVTRFVRFLGVPLDMVKVAKDMHEIALTSASLDEFEMRWFATIAPVYNLIHARRIFKKRVQKAVLNECLSLLHQGHSDSNFCMYYFLGLMSRFNLFNPDDPNWNEHKLRAVRNLFFLISKVAGIDFDVTRQMFLDLVPMLKRHQEIHLELIYNRAIAWLLYKNALHGKTLSSVAETLAVWEKHLGISILSHPQVLSGLYKELQYYDLAYAEREVSKIVFIVDRSKEIIH